MSDQVFCRTVNFTFIGICLCTGCGFALAGAKSGLNTFSFGNTYAGATGSYSVNVKNSTNYSNTNLSTKGTVNFLKKSVKGVDFSANVENQNGKKSSTYQLQVAGYTVDSGSKTVSYTWSKGIPVTLAQASLPVTIGVVPVTIKGSVGGRADISCTLELASSGVGLSGSASSSTNGSASAGVGIPLLNLALRSDLQFGKTSLKPSIKVTPTTFRPPGLFSKTSLNLLI